MKNKIIYSFLLVFLVSLFSSTKEIKGTCDKTSCNQVIKKDEAKDEAKEAETEAEYKSEKSFPSVGVFLINI